MRALSVIAYYTHDDFPVRPISFTFHVPLSRIAPRSKVRVPFWRGKGKAILDCARPGGIAEPDRVFTGDADQAVDCGEQSAGVPAIFVFCRGFG
jgi:hypothetical protein